MPPTEQAARRAAREPHSLDARPALVRDAGGEAGTLRRLLLAVVLVGAAGLCLELLLLEHVESPQQWIPLLLLVAVLGVGGAAAVRPGRGVLLVLRALMLGALVAGAVGVVLHLQGNIEFELERDPSLGGTALLWEALRGATPALAPGAMAQLGLLGLLFTWRHPALARRERA